MTRFETSVCYPIPGGTNQFSEKIRSRFE